MRKAVIPMRYLALLLLISLLIAPGALAQETQDRRHEAQEKDREDGSRTLGPAHGEHRPQDEPGDDQGQQRKNEGQAGGQAAGLGAAGNPSAPAAGGSRYDRAVSSNSAAGAALSPSSKGAPWSR